MKKIRNIIIIISIIIVIMIIIIAIALKNNQSNQEVTENYVENAENEGGDESTLYQTNKVKDPNIFYSISYCIERYYNSLFYEDGVNIQTDIEEKSKEIYNMLSKEYIDTNEITQANVFEKSERLDNTVAFTPIEIDSYSMEEYEIFKVTGELKDSETEQVFGERKFIVTLDYNNTTYSIYPLAENTDMTKVNIGTDEANMSPIEKNDNNQFIIITTKYDALLKRYVAYYKSLTKTNLQKAYDMLEEEYKTKRFGNFEKFQQYIQNNQDIVERINVAKYQIQDGENYTQYVILDDLGNYYLIKENAVMDFEIMLDTYTIDLPEFLEKYESADRQNKIGMNIEKILSAINLRDYEYVYNHLDENFKNNYYQTEQAFENDIKTKLFDYNYVEYNTYEEQGNLGIMGVIIYNSDKSQQRNMNVIMRIEEGTDFVMSFSIE